MVNPQENSLRMLLARVSILSVCVLAVSAAPARGQSSARTTQNVPADKSGDAPTKAAAGEAGSAVSLEELLSTIKRLEMRVKEGEASSAASLSTIKRLEMRVKELENKLDKGATDATPSVAAGKAVKEDAVLDKGSTDATASVAAANAAKEDAVKEETIKDDALKEEAVGEETVKEDAVGGEPAKPVATRQDLSWAKGDFKIQLFGAVRLDLYYNSARTQGPGMPAFLFPKFAGGFSQHTISLNARNSMVGLLFTGPDIGKFHSGGKIQAVFVDNTNVFADRNGFMLTQAYGELYNENWRFAAGLQLDVFAPNLPTILPFTADGTPVGNTIKGQIRVERYLKLGSDSQLTFQGALSEPLNSIKTPDISLDEDNGKPNVEGRIAFGLGSPARLGLLIQRPVEVGVSGVVGQLRRTSLPSEPPRRVISTTWGVNVDFRVNLADRYGFKGEMYTGQGLGQMGGGVVQTLDAVTSEAIRSTGGWVEGYVYLTPNLHNHTGIFIDDPNNNDITGLPDTLFGRTRNRVVFNTLLWDLGGEKKKFRIGAEFTFRKTEYKDPTSTGRLPNSGFGIMPQFQWLF